MQATAANQEQSIREKRTAKALKAFMKMKDPIQLYVEGIARGALLTEEMEDGHTLPEEREPRKAQTAEECRAS